MMVIGMIGAFIFILIQLILLVDFAHAWNERWLNNYEESQSKGWFAGTRFDSLAYHILIFSSRVLPSFNFYVLIFFHFLSLNV